MSQCEYLGMVRDIVAGEEHETGEDLKNELIDEFHGHSHRACGTAPPITQTGRSTTMRPFWHGTGAVARPDQEEDHGRLLPYQLIGVSTKYVTVL